jgi:hypothetical protein
MFKRSLLIAVLLIVLILACTKDEEDGKTPYELDKIEFTSFKILANSASGLTTESKVLIDAKSPVKVYDHGVVLLKDGVFLDKIALGELSENSFQTTVNSGLVKGQRYAIYPYLFAKNTLFHGDTLEFESKVEIDFVIDKVSPLEGFLNDTILIKGRNFCRSSETNKNVLQLGGANQRMIYESDSLIKAVILPNIPVSELSAVLTTCGVATELEDPFVISAPVLDTIAPHEAYVGEHFFIHGKNLHPAISRVWLDDFEIALEDTSDLDKLEATVTKDFPSGLLDLKIQVLDGVIERKAYFQSTTPVIHEIDKIETGFLDTLTIKGNYFLQPNSELQVQIGNRPQTIISSSRNEIVVVIDKYFEENAPTLNAITGVFNLEENITMLPPQIIAVDKDAYNLENDSVSLKTRYFLGYPNNVRVGNAGPYANMPFETVDSSGVLVLSLDDWLDVNDNFPHFEFDSDGEIKIELTTHYGNSSVNINIFPPKIQSIVQSAYYHSRVFPITIAGMNFGFAGSTEVYVDDVLIPYTGLSNFVIRNKAIQFPVPEFIEAGTHSIKLVTGGQVSDEITFELIDVVAENLTINSGTRKDVFELSGKNLDGNSHISIYANGTLCNIIERTSDTVKFQIPYFLILEAGMEITFRYGDKITGLGTINGIEPYEKSLDYLANSNYYRGSSYFEYQNEFYFLNNQGIFKFNLATQSWETFETNMGNINGYNSHSEVSVQGDKVYVPYGNTFQIYDMLNRQWESLDLVFEEYDSMIHGIVIENEAYIILREVSNTQVIFYKYDLQTHEKSALSQPIYPPSGSSTFDDLLRFGNTLYLNVQNNNIIAYDVAADSWSNLGYPTSFKYKFDTNLYVHNNILYLSGGRGNGLEFHELFALDLSGNTWTEKTYLPSKLTNHAVFGSGDQLYFLLGGGQYGYNNQYLFIYDINQDPY